MLRALAALTCLFAVSAPSAQVTFAVEADRPQYTTSDTLRLTFTVTNPTPDPVTIAFGSGQTVSYEVGGLNGPFGYCFFTTMSFDLVVGAGESAVVAGGKFDLGSPGEPGCYDLVFDDPALPALAPGEYEIEARLLATNLPPVTATTSLTLREPVASEGPADTRRFSLGPSVPNPTTGVVRVALRVDGPREVRLDVLDARGRVVWTEVGVVSDVQTVRLDLSDLPAGLYLVRAMSGGEVRAVRAVRAH